MIFKTIRHKLRIAASKRHEKKKLKTRSPKWDSFSRAFLGVNGACAACASVTNLQVHHKQPFHLHPELELDQNNLIVLCMGPWECHLNLGHGDNFKCYNPNIEKDAVEFRSSPMEFQRKDIQKRAKANRKK